MEPIELEAAGKKSPDILSQTPSQSETGRMRASATPWSPLAVR